MFHNGITIISKRLKSSDDYVEIGGQYYVVNGCQSLSALHTNGGSLTDDLRILTKFIQLDPASPWAQTVTRYSNNQNGVKARDFKSNHAIQIRLQNDFKKHYSQRYFFEIKRGEKQGGLDVISNESAGLYLMAFDLGEPWSTHRGYQVFDDKHSDIFGRPAVTADRIVLCHLIISEIIAASERIEHRLFAKHVITRYMLLYVVRQIIAKDGLGSEILGEPEKFVRAPNDAKRFSKCVKNVLQDVVIDLNAELEGVGEEFDYRDKLRDSEWVKGLARTLTAEYLKMVARNRIPGIEKDWRQSLEKQAKIRKAARKKRPGR